MTTCISRRANADRYAFSLINEQGELGKQIWTEYRCPNLVSVEGRVCLGCRVKVPNFEFQSQTKCDHGIVGGPYPEDSKLYGSPYFLKEVKAGWMVEEHDEIRAKAAMLEASMGRKKAVEVVNVISEPTIPAQATIPAEPVKQKRKYVRKVPLIPKGQSVKETNTGTLETSEVKDPKPVITKERKPRQKKVIPTVDVIKPIENPLEPKLIEVVAPPLSITECIVVKVKKTRIEGKEYYYDSSSGKLYGVSINGVGLYKGRYNAETEILDTTFPDSDCE